VASACVIVFGYGSLGLAALETCDRLGVIPAAVVVPGNRRGHDVDVMVTAATARGWRLLVQPVRSQVQPFLDQVRAIAPDVILVWSYPMLLPAELLALPARGAFNLHSGLLPGYRGGHTMNWALINGERETAVTLHHLDAGIDTGPVVDECRFAIEWRDDVVTVHQKLRAAGEALLTKWWPAMAAGTAPAVPQDESHAHYYRMRTPADGRVDWSASNIAIYNLVRALVAPWPGAFTTIADTTLVLRWVEPVDAAGPSTPGTVVGAEDDGLIVAAGEGGVRLQRVEVAGRLVTAGDLRGMGVSPGARLG